LTYDSLALKPGPKPKDLTGKRIGHLSVIRPTGKRTRYGLVWLVRCDCGKELEYTPAYLLSRPRRKSQIPRSCGCYGKRNRSPKYKGAGDLSSTKFRGIMAGAKHRDLPFRITIQYAWALFLKQKKLCALTGAPITLSPSRVDAGASTASLDRIDSSKGYICGNVQWVHVTINLMKSSLRESEFVSWCRQVSKYAYGKEFGLGTEKEPWLY
jgi:hypothetical protein